MEIIFIFYSYLYIISVHIILISIGYKIAFTHNMGYRDSNIYKLTQTFAVENPDKITYGNLCMVCFM